MRAFVYGDALRAASTPPSSSNRRVETTLKASPSSLTPETPFAPPRLPSAVTADAEMITLCTTAAVISQGPAWPRNAAFYSFMTQGLSFPS
ncbi:hypothetical protein GCM10027075_07890 [Streptomyces heilongjiangensis]